MLTTNALLPAAPKGLDRFLIGLQELINEPVSGLRNLEELVLVWLRNRGLIYNPDWGPLSRIVHLHLVEHSRQFHAKQLTGAEVFNELPQGEDYLLEIRLNEAVLVQLGVQNQVGDYRQQKVILPTFVNVNKLLDEVVVAASISQTIHTGVTDASVPVVSGFQTHFVGTRLEDLLLHCYEPSTGQLRRLPSNTTLAEVGVSSNNSLIVYSAQLAGGSGVSKMARTSVAVTLLRQWVTRVFDVPIDVRRDRLLQWLANAFDLDDRREPDLLVFVSEFPTRSDFQPTTTSVERADLNEDSSPGPVAPIIIALADLEVYAGPDEYDFPLVGIMAKGQSARVTGTSQSRTWWQIDFQDFTNGLCWVQAKFVEARHVANVPQMPEPRVWKRGSLYEMGVLQDVNTHILMAFPNEIDWLRRRFHEKFRENWEVKRLAITPEDELVVRFAAPANPFDVYLRIIKENWFLQTRLFATPLQRRVGSDVIVDKTFLNYSGSLQNRIAPARIAIDQQLRLVLQMTMTKMSFQELVKRDINPVEFLADSANVVRPELDDWLTNNGFLNHNPVESLADSANVIRPELEDWPTNKSFLNHEVDL